MRKLYLLLYILFATPIVFAETAPAHFDVGDIPPRGKIKVNMNPKSWPGYHDIKCDIIDPSYSSIVRISTDIDHSYNFAEVNKIRYYLPMQISLSKEQNKLVINNFYNRQTEENNYLTFENLDDDITISVKNCETSPYATLSEKYLYLPSEIICADGNCKLYGELNEYWSVSTLGSSPPDGKYKFNSVYYYASNRIDAYYSLVNNNTNSLRIVNLKSVESYYPVINENTTWAGGGDNYYCSSSSPVACPFYNPMDNVEKK